VAVLAGRNGNAWCDHLPVLMKQMMGFVGNPIICLGVCVLVEGNHLAIR
jgi:hypothetical protein